MEICARKLKLQTVKWIFFPFTENSRSFLVLKKIQYLVVARPEDLNKGSVKGRSKRSEG
jgi:hypothetical protein